MHALLKHSDAFAYFFNYIQTMRFEEKGTANKVGFISLEC